MNARMTHAPKRLMVCFFGLLVIVMGLGLVTGRNPGPKDVGARHALPLPVMTMPVPSQQKGPTIPVKQAFPQSFWGTSPPLTTSPVVAPIPPTAFSQIKQLEPMNNNLQSELLKHELLTRRDRPMSPMLPFQEAHWQGLELIPLTLIMGRILKISPDAKGVIVDEVTGPADMQGFQAGDLITSVGQVPTSTLESFLKAADRVRNRRRTEIRLMRNGQLHSLVLTSIQDRLGTANGETAPMIKPGSRSPHEYKGPCTQCHRIGTKGQLSMDQGDLLTRKAPPIRAGQAQPHRDRGECTACHKIIQ